MVDSSKRSSLKSMGAMMALPLVPNVVSATTGAAQQLSPALNSQPSSRSITELNADLSITVLAGPYPVVMVTNTTDKLIILRRIHPAIVHIGEKPYNLNHSLTSSAYAIGAGKTRHIAVRKASQSMVEPALATYYSGKPVRIASITNVNENGQEFSTTTSYFS